jgi:ABC-2 type transport system permease protein
VTAVLRSVYTKTVREGLRGYAWWSAGIAALVLLTVSIYPSIRDNDDLNQAVQDYPDAVKAFFGGNFDLSTGAGYLSAELFSFMIPLLFLIYAITAGARAIAGEEEAGTLDLLLAQPISRLRLVAEKFAAQATQLAVLGVATFLVTALAARLVDMDVGIGRIAAGSVGVYLLALAHGALGLLGGAATGQRTVAYIVAVAVATGGYVLNGLAQLVDSLERWRVLSPFEWYGDPLREGLSLQAGLLALVALVAFVAAVPAFQRRDIAV